MGYLKNNFGMTMIGRTPDGTCPLCAVKHDPSEPHNRDSLAYQYAFYDQHGRWPTWADAMAHCTPEIQSLWRAALMERGINVGEEADHGQE